MQVSLLKGNWILRGQKFCCPWSSSLYPDSWSSVPSSSGLSFVSNQEELLLWFCCWPVLVCSPLCCPKTMWPNGACWRKKTQIHLCLFSRVLIEKMMSSSTGDGSAAASWRGDYINIKETSPPGWACCWCSDCPSCFYFLPLFFLSVCFQR